jgi:hypothetical protein
MKRFSHLIFFVLCCRFFSDLALRAQVHHFTESGNHDHELEFVKAGVLGTVNVLRELDPASSFRNLVSVESNVMGKDSTIPLNTIDGSAKGFRPVVDSTTPVIFTYMLPSRKVVSSLVISYEEPLSDFPKMVRLEGTEDSGQTWFEVFHCKARRGNFIKFFQPVNVNGLRLTQEEGSRRTLEVFAYADPDTAALPLFGETGKGNFNFLRELWYDGKIKQHLSPQTAVWTRHAGYGHLPHVPFSSKMASRHDGAWGDAEERGKRLFLRLELDSAYLMNYGVVSGMPDGDKLTFGKRAKVEIYTANENLDPGKLAGTGVEDLTAQGWVLQQAWQEDANACKDFQLKFPGKYSQILLVWDAVEKYDNDSWSHLEMFGTELRQVHQAETAK